MAVYDNILTCGLFFSFYSGYFGLFGGEPIQIETKIQLLFTDHVIPVRIYTNCVGYCIC